MSTTWCSMRPSRRPGGSSKPSQGRVAESSFSGIDFYTFLHRGLVLRGTTGDGSVCHMRETPAHWYDLVRNWTIRDADHLAHNPKVGGSRGGTHRRPRTGTIRGDRTARGASGPWHPPVEDGSRHVHSLGATAPTPRLGRVTQSRSSRPRGAVTSVTSAIPAVPRSVARRQDRGRRPRSGSRRSGAAGAALRRPHSIPRTPSTRRWRRRRESWSPR